MVGSALDQIPVLAEPLAVQEELDPGGRAKHELSRSWLKSAPPIGGRLSS